MNVGLEIKILATQVVLWSSIYTNHVAFYESDFISANDVLNCTVHATAFKLVEGFDGIEENFTEYEV